MKLGTVNSIATEPFCSVNNTDKEYALEVLNSFPALPSAPGLLETWYLSDNCSGEISGYFWAKAYICLQDPKAVVNINGIFGYDFSVFVLNLAVGSLPVYGTTDRSCLDGIQYGPYDIQTGSADIPLECRSLKDNYTSSIADMGPGVSRTIKFDIKSVITVSTGSSTNTNDSVFIGGQNSNHSYNSNSTLRGAGNDRDYTFIGFMGDISVAVCVVTGVILFYIRRNIELK
jgi:hypothetical protein